MDVGRIIPLSLAAARRDCASGFRALRKDLRLLLVSPIPPLASTGDNLGPTKFSLMPRFMPDFIHDFKHAISATFNRSIPLLSMKSISRGLVHKRKGGCSSRSRIMLPFIKVAFTLHASVVAFC